MKIRRILALFLVLAALLSLSACAKQSDIDRLTEEVAALESEKARLSGENEKLKSDNSALRDEVGKLRDEEDAEADVVVYAYGKVLTPADIALRIDGSGNTVLIKGYDVSYENNRFISLRDTACALNGTSRQFNVELKANGKLDILRGQNYVPVGGENAPGNGKVRRENLTSGYILLNGGSLKNAVIPGENLNDAYLKVSDISMLLDLDIELEENGEYSLSTSSGFDVEMDELENSNFFESLNGTLLGNADTGEVIYSCKADNQTAIASTTKIMTYLLVMEAVEAGRISLSDIIPVTEKVHELSMGEDARIYMEYGQEIAAGDHLTAMMCVSCNESALALAEFVSGSEEAFVDAMNRKAAELGLSTAVFYNPHGLPDFSDDDVSAKRSNLMSANDMFTLCREVLKRYPQILDLTSQKYVWLRTMPTGENTWYTNSNPLFFYNMDGITGLKTGTSNRAGSCLISTIYANNKGQQQKIVCIVFGGEDRSEMLEKSALLLKYARQYYGS